MDWVRSMLAAAGTAFDHAGTGPVAIPLAFVLGVIGAVASACCALPVLSVVAGYAGTRTDRTMRERLISAAVFVLGAASALVILGVVAASVGQLAQTNLGRYWKLVAGMIAIVTGLVSMNLLPLNPLNAVHRMRLARGGSGWFGSLMFGLAGGGAVSVCTLACNPGVFIVLGAAALQGFTIWMAGILLAYSFGFALPLGALMFGVSTLAGTAGIRSAGTVVRYVAGLVLIAVGFYLLCSF